MRPYSVHACVTVISNSPVVSVMFENAFEYSRFQRPRKTQLARK